MKIFNMVNTLVEALTFGRFTLEEVKNPYEYVRFKDSDGEVRYAVIDNTDIGEMEL